MSKNLYKLAWFGVPIIFLASLFWKGEFCLMYSCIGDNNVGIAYGITGIIIYSIILKALKIRYLQKEGGFSREFWNVHGIKSGFFYYLVILIVLLVYFLGKINSI